MEIAKVNGVELEYEVIGSGEPVLLISPVLADGFLPLLSEPALADQYQLIRYHKRGWVGSTHTPPPVSIADHAADAAALLHHLGLSHGHIAGHSSGAAVAAQLALDEPTSSIHWSCSSFRCSPCPPGKPSSSRPTAFAAYGNGDHEGALAIFMSAVSGVDWGICRAELTCDFPGRWPRRSRTPTPSSASSSPPSRNGSSVPNRQPRIHCPVLSVLGSDTQPLWVDVADFLRTSLPHVEECTIDGVGHLLHIQRPEPVARAMAEFLASNSMASN